jgi:hypothetical protein
MDVIHVTVEGGLIADEMFSETALSGARQLLEDLIVRSELDIGGNAQIPAPESEGVFRRLCGERGGNTNACLDRTLLVGSLPESVK